MNRRSLLTGAVLAPLTLAAEAHPAAAQAPAGDLPAPKYTLSVNLELMFPGGMAHADRIRLIADQGCKAFSFWAPTGKDLDAMEAAQKKTGLACGSITGNNKTGWNTGLTKTGFEKEFLEDFSFHADVARRFGCQNLITFVGAVQKDIPYETQYRQIIDGLRRAADIAEKKDVYLVLEPLNSVESPQMSVVTTAEGFKIIKEVNHPRIKLDYDMYHRQLSDGNLINNLKLGLEKEWIRFVEVGDVPGRYEAGTGETNYANIFKALRQIGYGGYVGLEHKSSKTPEHAIEVMKKVAGFA